MENKSSFLKDAIESITTLANKAKEPKTLEYNSHLYLIDEGGNANRIWEPKDTPQRKRVCSLDALVALIKHEAVDRYATNAHPLFVNCESFGSVTCYLSPDSGNYENRVTLYEAAATDVPGFRDSKWSLEEAMVALRSKFQHTDDVDYILGLIGRMDVNQQISSEDNGVTQTVQVRSGVSFVENQQVRPIVSLAPYRTFQEVLQLESDFVFRVDQDRNVSLTEADGGMSNHIAAFLTEKIGCFMRTVSSQDHQTVKLPFFIIVQHSFYLIKTILIRLSHLLEGLSGGSDNGSTLC